MRTAVEMPKFAADAADGRIEMWPESFGYEAARGGAIAHVDAPYGA